MATEITREMLAHYLANGATKCPVCRSDSINGSAFESEGNYIWQTITCQDCGAKWDDEFTLTGAETDHVHVDK